MPRPCKCRRVCALPRVRFFSPADGSGGQAAVVMTVDEYEAIRLIDHLGLAQDTCAARMNVARTTAQAIYCSARAKLARCLVEGRPLKIEGGSYTLCGGAAGCTPCRRARRRRQNQNGDEDK